MVTNGQWGAALGTRKGFPRRVIQKNLNPFLPGERKDPLNLPRRDQAQKILEKGVGSHAGIPHSGEPTVYKIHPQKTRKNLFLHGFFQHGLR